MKVNVDGFWLPRASSTLAPDIDAAWDFAYGVSLFFFIGIVGALAFFMVKYKRKTDTDVTSEIDHSTAIEITWTVIPSILCIACFIFGFVGFIRASVAPAGAFEVQVTAQKWFWTFTYPNGKVVPGELRIPKGRPVKLLISSTDVLHSFFVPEFRTKVDAIPGNYTTLWFEATDEGEKVIFCTEYCGTNHSEMLAKAIVMPAKEFDAWMEAAADDPNEPPVKKGEKLFAANACLSCHSVADASVKVGPSLKGVFGRVEALADGSTVTIDENYLRESIENPNAKIVKGFNPVMPAFKGVLKDKQIEALIAYLKEQK